MEDIIINSVRSSMVLPVRSTQRSSTAEQNTDKKVNKDNSSAGAGKAERITVDLDDTVKKVKEFAKTFTTKLSFDIDPKSNESIIYVTEKDTGKLIRQIPPEDIQRITKRMDEIVGLLFTGSI